MSKIIATPFVKWVGGKRQLITEIEDHMPKLSTISTYYEPFVGGGAVFLNAQPKKAVINDFNQELILTYNVIKNDVEALIEDLKTHVNEEGYFYKLREQDRELDYVGWSDIKIASRFIYLNKTCYNGLYRVNSQGFFNSPFGRYKNPNIVDEFNLRALNDYFNSGNIRFVNGDFEDAVKNIRKGSFVYFDPPYAPLTPTSNFTGYTAGGFSEKDQVRLAKLCRKLDSRGVRFLLSNSNVELIQKLYDGFHVDIVNAKRSINSKGDGRGAVEEVLVYNYDR